MKLTFSKKILLILFGTVFGLLLAEGVLRIYNPLKSRVKGGQIALLSNYERQVVLKKSFDQKGLDDTINYSTNSIGFRGEDPPQDFGDSYTIFTVGGSTTECSLLDDEKTWPFILQKTLNDKKENIWVCNAGIDGASTYGHSKLLEQEILELQPNMVIFLVGINDLHKARTGRSDDFLITSREFQIRRLASKSELFSFLWNLYRTNKTKEMQVGHFGLKYPEAVTEEEFHSNEAIYSADQIAYKERLSVLVKKCLDKNIKPILVSQPVFKVNEDHPYFGISLYNQTTAEVATENNILFIDLANEMDNNPDFFYDSVHYTNIGAKAVAQIIANHLIGELNFLKD